MIYTRTDFRKSVLSEKQSLESRKYEFTVDGTMPVLEFDLSAGDEKEKLHLELYNPLSNEIFEAKFVKGRLEVDRDGSITYFTTSAEEVNVSLFCGRNLTIKLTKSGDVTIKTPSKIVLIEEDRPRTNGVTSDTVKLKLK